MKVKNLAEDRMKKKDKEIKELRERLNHHAQRSLVSGLDSLAFKYLRLC